MISEAGPMNPWAHRSDPLGCPWGHPIELFRYPLVLGELHRIIGVPSWAKHTLVRVGMILEVGPIKQRGHLSDTLGCPLAHGGIPLNYWDTLSYMGHSIELLGCPLGLNLHRFKTPTKNLCGLVAHSQYIVTILIVQDNTIIYFLGSMKNIK